MIHGVFRSCVSENDFPAMTCILSSVSHYAVWRKLLQKGVFYHVQTCIGYEVKYSKFILEPVHFISNT